MTFRNVFLPLMILWLSPALVKAQLMSESEIRQSLQVLKKANADTAGIELLLRLSEHYILKPGEAKVDMDSALMLVEKAEQFSKKINYTKGICNSYFLYAMALRESGNKEKGKLYAGYAIKAAEQHKLYRVLGQSYVELSQYYAYWVKDELAPKIEYTQKAIEAFALSGDKEKQASSLQFLGDLHHLQWKTVPLAINELKQALQLYEEIGHTKLQGVYDLLGICYMYIDDFSTALRYGLLAEQTAVQVKDSSMQLCTVLIRVGLTYQRLQDYQYANNYFLKALAVAEKHGDVPAIHECVSNSAICTMMTYPEETLNLFKTVIGKYPVAANLQPNVDLMLLRIYNYANRFTEAQKYFDIIFRDYDKNSTEETDIIKANYGTVFLTRSKQYDKAEQLLKDFDALPRSAYHSAYARSASYNWFALDSARGNYLAALQHYQNYRRLDDSILSAKKIKQIEVTEIEFETEKKQQSINLLTKENQLQIQKIKQSELVRNGTVTGIFVLAGFLGLVYNQYNNKRKSNQQLLERQKEINEKNKTLESLVQEKQWLLKEVYHRVKNNLQTVVSLLESQSAYLQNDALSAIQDSQNRIHAMSLIHQKLYQSDNVASIDMASYLPELVSCLKESFANTQQIRFKLNISPIQMDVSQAIPVGLILNEAITNSIKYAFTSPGNYNLINITMTSNTDNFVELTVMDNGIGLAQGTDHNKHSGLGLKLMKGLTEDLDGHFSISSHQGTRVCISFVANTILPTSPTISDAAIV